MIRQHEKNDITHIDCDAAPDPYRIAFCGSSFRIPLQPIGAQATNRTATHPRLLQCSGFR